MFSRDLFNRDRVYQAQSLFREAIAAPPSQKIAPNEANQQPPLMALNQEKKGQPQQASSEMSGAELSPEKEAVSRKAWLDRVEREAKQKNVRLEQQSPLVLYSVRQVP